MNHAQLELLMQIQDLDLMLRDFGDAKAASEEVKLGFPISGPETLREARSTLAAKVSEEALRLYERIASRFPRAIVPMRDGICFGCFVRQPTKKEVDNSDEQDVETCQRCGRILFRFRFPATE